MSDSDDLLTSSDDDHESNDQTDNVRVNNEIQSEGENDNEIQSEGENDNEDEAAESVEVENTRKRKVNTLFSSKKSCLRHAFVYSAVFDLAGEIHI